MSRLLEEVGEQVLLVLLKARHEGDVAEAPGFGELLTLSVETDRYRLFDGGVAESYYLQLSQGRGRADPTNVIITCFGLDANTVTSAVDEFLGKTGIKEQEVPDGELEALLQVAERLFQAGVLPKWLLHR